MYIKINILKLFAEKPETWLHLREFSKVSKLNVATARKYLNILKNEGMLLCKKERNLVMYKANKENPEFRNFKIFNTKEKIIKSGLIQFLEEKYNYPPIILYGSSARGEDSEKSDIDIFILSESKIHTDLKSFEKKIGKKIHLIIMEKNELKKSKYLANSIINGFAISGFLEVF